jgi:hypothetical protein
MDRFCPCLAFIKSFVLKESNNGYKGTQEIEEEEFINHHEDLTLEDRIQVHS